MHCSKSEECNSIGIIRVRQNGVAGFAGRSAHCPEPITLTKPGAAIHFKLKAVSFILLMTVLALNLEAQPATTTNASHVETITVTGGQTTSRPTQIPSTIVGITAAEIATTINAFDSEDVLKYFPSLNVRKRFIGDFDHAVLASRASGTGNSARSLVYADGILLSNLLGNGASYTPRWGLVTPSEIARVDVLYGPFSAAYPGNSVGAVVDYVTRMPQQFEAHAKVASFSQDFSQYSTEDTYTGYQASAGVGNKRGAWSWRLDMSRLDSQGQPVSFANKLASARTVINTGVSATPVTGAIADRNPQNRDWWILGATGQVHTMQDHAKLKLAYDLSSTLQASYTLGWWRNEAERNSETYLRDSAGQPVYSGIVVIADAASNEQRAYSLAAADFAPGLSSLTHVMQGLSLKSTTGGTFDWEVAASVYDYADDLARSPTVTLPAAGTGGAGRITDQDGTGWNTLALKAVWRPDGTAGNHILDMGYQRDSFQLRTLVSQTQDWINGPAAARVSAFAGSTELNSIYVQDTWQLAAAWKTTLGGRLEQWHAFDGAIANAGTIQFFGERKDTWFSPKATLAFELTPEWQLQLSTGRAVRMPTVAELYQGSLVDNVIVNNDPNLKPEQAWTTELSAERDLGSSTARVTLFHEDTKDALYSQTNVLVSPNVTNIQNVDHIRTSGVELAYQASDVLLDGLDLMGSLTYAKSTIVQNDRFPASVGKWQPRVPLWRANFLATWQPSENLSLSMGARYSGKQYGTLDNSDANATTYTGVSAYFVTDLRVRYAFSTELTGALGIDNLNNAHYWAFHPYTRRTLTAELEYNF